MGTKLIGNVMKEKQDVPGMAFDYWDFKGWMGGAQKHCTAVRTAGRKANLVMEVLPYSC